MYLWLRSYKVYLYGFKTYNNYAIVTSRRNQDYVTEDTIYFINENKNTYHRIGCTELDCTTAVGYRNSDFERFKITVSSSDGGGEESVYYYRHDALPCYYCIVNRYGNKEKNIFDQELEEVYNTDEAKQLREKYYKALGRERYNVRKDIIW